MKRKPPLPQTHEEYLDRQSKCSLKEGDKVLITPTPATDGYLRDTLFLHWNSKKRHAIGQIGQIVYDCNYSSHGILVKIQPDFTGENMSAKRFYPYFMLKKVQE